MPASTKRVPEGQHTVTPHLVVRGAAAAIDYYKKAFRAEEIRRMPGPDGTTIMFAELKIGDSRGGVHEDKRPERFVQHLLISSGGFALAAFQIKISILPE